MAFKLTQREFEMRDGLIAELEIEEAQVQAAIDKANAAILEILIEANGALTLYNEKLEVARDFIGDVAERLRGEYDDKSERWQESDGGVAADEMASAWEGLDFDMLDLLVVEPLDDFDINHRYDLEEAPTDADD